MATIPVPTTSPAENYAARDNIVDPTKAVPSGDVVVTGVTLPALPTGTEYLWFKMDGNGSLLDIIPGVA